MHNSTGFVVASPGFALLLRAVNASQPQLIAVKPARQPIA